MQEMNVAAEVGVCEEALSDLKYLAQDIREDFFEAYERGSSRKNILFLSHEVSRYAALFRILDIRLFDIHEQIKNLENYLTAKGR